MSFPPRTITTIPNSRRKRTSASSASAAICNGHGHNYTLEVTVKGDVNPQTGFVVDLRELKDILNREVMDALDHRHLNKEVPEFFTQIPTTENLAIAIWNRLQDKLKVAQAASGAGVRATRSVR